jgi:hypothetical protein
MDSKNEFLEFYSLLKNYSNIYSYLRGFENYKQQKINPHYEFHKNIPNKHLLNDNLVEKLKSIKEKCETYRKELLESKIKEKEYEKKINEIENDSFLQTIIHSHIKLQSKFGDEWNNSFLKQFTQFNFQNAIVEDNRGNKYENEFDPIINYLQTLLFISKNNGYNFLRGKNSNFYYHPSYNNFCLPSKLIINSTIFSFNIENELIEKNIKNVTKDLSKFKMGHMLHVGFDAFYCSSTIYIDYNNLIIKGLEGK